MSQLSFWRRTAIAVAFTAACSLAHAVDTTGRIKGTVTDPTGAALPGVVVTATNELTGVKSTTKTTASGDYLFQSLPTGTYDISVAPSSGFKGFDAKGVVINIDQEYVETIQLTVGGGGDTIEVQADAIQVNTTDMQLNNIVGSAQMEELPLIGRGFTALELILPGVQASSDRFGNNYSADGAQTQQSSYLINGADINDFALNTPSVTPNLDAIDQFNLITGPLNAEYDRNSGGIVSATIKQGTNHFHGDVFEFYRDTFLQTPNFFAYSTSTHKKTVTPYHQNIYGGTLGGPILRDKLFFFGAYQGTHQTVPDSSGNATVLSNGERTGNFSDDLGKSGGALGYSILPNPIPSSITIPGCVSGGGKNADTWASCAATLGGMFPAASFNAISAKLLSTYIPVANNGSTGYNFQSPAATKSNQYIGRIDYSLNPKNTFNFVGLYQKTPTTDAIAFTAASIPGFGSVSTATVQQYTFDYVRQFSATLLNDFAIHYTRFNFDLVEPQNKVNPSSLGFNITPQNTAAASVPTISIVPGLTLGFSTNGPQPRIDTNTQFDDNLSKSFGHHNLKFGYDGRKFVVSNPFYATNSGSYGFSSGGQYSSGDPALDFLFGNSNTYSQGSGAQIQAYAWLNYFYGQDTWRVTNALTIDYGIGYQIDTPLRSQQYGGLAVPCYVPGQQSVVFPTAPQGLNYPGDTGCGNAAHAYTRFGDFGPRLGFAYAPNFGWLSGGNAKKLSIRGGFGIYYNRTEEETALQALQTPPFGGATAGAQDFGGTPSFQDPFTDINGGGSEPNKFPFVFAKKGDKVDFTQYEPMYLSTYNANFRSPYAENFQVSVERELPSHIISRFTYVASLAHHNQTTTEGNPITPAGHADCLARVNTCGGQSRSIYRDEQNFIYVNHTQFPYTDPNSGINPYAAIGVVGSEGASNYNSFQASLEKGVSHGLQFQLSYTWAHGLDEASSFENSGFGIARGYNQFDNTKNYGDSAFDARQRLVFAPIYIVPFHTSGATFSPANVLLSGWEISAITTLATGFPFDVSYAGSSSNSAWCAAFTSYYACPDEPDQLASIVRTNPRTRIPTRTSRTSWFDGTGFAPAVTGTFGNTHRDEYHGPGINNSDIVLAKNFALSSDGNRRLQLRMTSSNAFNHTQFANPISSVSTSQAKDANGAYHTVLSSPGFGQITGAAAGRLTQLAAKIYF